MRSDETIIYDVSQINGNVTETSKPADDGKDGCHKDGGNFQESADGPTAEVAAGVAKTKKKKKNRKQLDKHQHQAGQHHAGQHHAGQHHAGLHHHGVKTKVKPGQENRDKVC